MNVQTNTKQKSAAAYDREKSAALNCKKHAPHVFIHEPCRFFRAILSAPLNWKKYAEHIFIHKAPRFLTAALLSALLCLLPQCTGARFSDAAPTCDVISGNVWEAKTSGTDDELYSVAVLGERLIATGDDGVIITSDDKGESWTDRTPSPPLTMDMERLEFVIASGERLIAVGDDDTIITSDDRGENWIDRTPSFASADILYSVAVSPDGTLIAVGYLGTILKSLDNGDTWSHKSVSGATTFFSVIFSQGSFLAFGTVSNIYRSTDDGENWTALSTSATPDPSFPPIAADEDTGEALFSRSFFGALAMAGRLTVVGQAGTVITSDDNGDSWDIQQSGRLENEHIDMLRACNTIDPSDPSYSQCVPDKPLLWSVSSIESRLVMVGNEGTILTSDDEGHSFMARESGTTETIRSVLGLGAGLGCYFIAVGDSGTVLVSKE